MSSAEVIADPNEVLEITVHTPNIQEALRQLETSDSTTLSVDLTAFPHGIDQLQSVELHKIVHAYGVQIRWQAEHLFSGAQQVYIVRLEREESESELLFRISHAS